MKMKNVIGFVRVSTSQQDLSVDNQISKIKSKANENKLKLKEIISEENVSGDAIKRDGFDKLIDEIKNKTVDCIICNDISRIGRRAHQTLKLIRLCLDKEIYIIDMMNGIDTRRPGGRLQASMMALFAEEELIKIRIRTREALNHKRMSGTPYSRSIPYGIQYIDGKLYRDETEMKNVSRIKNLHSRGWSWYKIGKTFNEEGIRTKNGKDWRTQSVINTYKFHYEKEKLTTHGVV